MKTLNSLMVMLCALSFAGLALLVMPGCETVKTQNDFIVDVAVSQGVARYVSAGASVEDRVSRREDLIAALSVARQFVASDEPVMVSDWADEFIRLMDWDSLSVTDQILISQVLELVRQEIELRSAGDEQVKVYLGRVIDVAINTASRL